MLPLRVLFLSSMFVLRNFQSRLQSYRYRAQRVFFGVGVHSGILFYIEDAEEKSPRKKKEKTPPNPQKTKLKWFLHDSLPCTRAPGNDSNSLK